MFYPPNFKTWLRVCTDAGDTKVTDRKKQHMTLPTWNKPSEWIKKRPKHFRSTYEKVCPNFNFSTRYTTLPGTKMPHYVRRNNACFGIPKKVLFPAAPGSRNAQGWIQPVSLGGSVIFGSQVSLQVHYCKNTAVTKQWTTKSPQITYVKSRWIKLLFGVSGSA